MKEIEYNLIRTKTGRMLFELRVPRLPFWKRSLARLHFHKDTYKYWEINDAFKRFEASKQYKPIMAVIDSFCMENKYRGWRKSHFSDRKIISFIHELDSNKISF